MGFLWGAIYILITAFSSDKFDKIRDPVVKDGIEEVIRSLAREAAVLFCDLAGETAKRYLKADCCRWEDVNGANPFSTCTCTIDHYCGPHKVCRIVFVSLISLFSPRIQITSRDVPTFRLFSSVLGFSLMSQNSNVTGETKYTSFWSFLKMHFIALIQQTSFLPFLDHIGLRLAHIWGGKSRYWVKLICSKQIQIMLVPSWLETKKISCLYWQRCTAGSWVAARTTFRRFCPKIYHGFDQSKCSNLGEKNALFWARIIIVHAGEFQPILSNCSNKINFFSDTFSLNLIHNFRMYSLILTESTYDSPCVDWSFVDRENYRGSFDIALNHQEIGVFDMPNPNRYDILLLSIFCKIPLSISIFSRMAISISISISIFFKLSLSISISISIFYKFPYRYFYRYRYFPNFLIDIFSILIFSK